MQQSRIVLLDVCARVESPRAYIASMSLCSHGNGCQNTHMRALQPALQLIYPSRNIKKWSWKMQKRQPHDFFFGMEGGHLLNANRLIQTSINIDQGACNAIPGSSRGVRRHRTKKTSAACGPGDFYKEYHDLSSQQTVKKVHEIPCPLFCL